MPVIALFTLDDQLLRAAQQQAAAQQSDHDDWDKPSPIEQIKGDTKGVSKIKTFSSQEVVYCGLPKRPDISALPALYWLDKSLKGGVVDSLTKLNPALVPDAAVHAYHLGLLATEPRFARARTMTEQLQAFSLSGTQVKVGEIGEGVPLARILFGQFGGYCLHINNRARGKSMAIGLITGPQTIYAFDASIGLFKIESPTDLANMLTIWIESEQSLWYAAHYELWRVTL